MKAIALVIGIDNYSHPDDFQTLHCAVNDAKCVADVLEKLKISCDNIFG